ncbi:transient receptor potential cation channel subfamily M member 2 isoform X2 [Brienomyrus brachyistius]|uniref:transient receptor potential cation channel subfamily M member 2 isoform X2 n=1 Tax=Brienomyrus brachyistius TaxID=42636 RepID=UPI0020B252C7|nr:transient receptor potential cation channel subfamily M member 2 isoform X2 [Brienomyrus brachyistius]
MPEKEGAARKDAKPVQGNGFSEMLSRSETRIHPVECNDQQRPTHPSRPLSRDDKRCAFMAWIKENIRKKECAYYMEDGREGVCKCGYPKTHHADEAIKPEEFLGESWDKYRHIRETPTDAFGDISLGGHKVGKYIRVSTDTSSETLYELLTEHWRLRPPNLLISVTGGAKNFYMKTRLKEMFRRGLIKVAQTTGAWIVTGGTHTGVMKHVGMAMRDYALSSSAFDAQVVAIGVVTWGVVHNREPLVHPEGCFPAHYSLDEQGQGRLSCLDVNHSHFLLVDDGTHGQYGAEIALRSRLEKLISQQPLGQRADGGVKIPVVCVVLEGGPGTLNTIYNAMVNGTPSVILEGSGRVADVIAHAARLPLSQVNIALIRKLMKRFFSKEYESFSSLMIIDWTKKIQDIIRTPHLLTVFRIDEEKHVDLDVAILQALLKASRTCDTPGHESWEQQLELAVAWNRVDIAKSEIFTEESQWKSTDLHRAMLSALVGHKPDFVKLFLENNVSLREFLHEDTLCELYAHLEPGCLFLQRLRKRMKAEKENRNQLDRLGRSQVSLRHVSEEVHHFLGSFTQPLYSLKHPCAETPEDDVCVTLQTKVSAELQSSSTADEERETEALRDPGRDLFLWAVLQNDKELAEIAWEQCRDSLTAALAASRILKRMALEEDQVGDEAEEMRKLANHYERQAIGVFSECYSWDEQRAERLLVRISPSWGRVTCLRLALEADDKSFVAHVGVQAFLTQTWCGELAMSNPQWKVLVCMAFPLLIYTGFVSFRRDEEILKASERKNKLKDAVASAPSDTRWKAQLRHGQIHMNLKSLDCISRLAGFVTAPMVKFYWNIVSYFSFLLLFGFVLVVDFQLTPSWMELLLYLWLMSLVVEEVRQLFDDPDGSGFQTKVKRYINDLWNILDVLSILLFTCGFILRLITATFYAGKVILCIDFIIFCLRLMAIFTISKTLGPKIIIVRRMMMDLFFFMFLLSIWVVAYGVAKQGILIQNEDRLEWIMRGVVYEPYLIIFGNVPTDIDRVQFSMDSCTLNGSDPLKPRCPVLAADQTPVFPEWLTILLLCVYLLFANILLLNLLIAIFNYTFQEVQDNTDCFWKFQRYELIKEYHSRPAFPPPFILLSHLYLLLTRFLLCRPSKNKHRQFKEQLTRFEEEEMLSWEALMQENFLAKSRQEQSQSVEYRVQHTSEKVGDLVGMLEVNQNRDTDSMTKRLARLEEQVSRSAKALSWIMNALKSQGCASEEEVPSLTLQRSHTETEPASRSTAEGAPCHIKARHLHYPGSQVTRFPVPEEKVPWEVEFTLYNPPVYSTQRSTDSRRKGTPSAGDSDVANLQKYRNPGGRTGLMGRGCLDQLGPNQIHDPVITRWWDGDSPTLEFLAVWEESEGRWAIPGGLVHSDETLPERLERILGKKVCDKIKVRLAEDTRLQTVYKGYVDDDRNTDNAWVETTAFNIHLGSSALLDEVNQTVQRRLLTKESVWWREVSSTALMCAHHKEVLRRVAELHQGAS